MSDRYHRTDTICSKKNVQVGRQILHWLEFQLLDERGEPLPHQPYRAINEATRCQLIPEFSGQSDAQGVIRLEALHPLAVTLLLVANPLAEVLQTRRVRALRAERPVSTPLQIPYRYEPPPADFSPVEKQALDDGHGYHYLRIGQLCDRFPDLNPAWPELDKLPRSISPTRASAVSRLTTKIWTAAMCWKSAPFAPGRWCCTTSRNTAWPMPTTLG